MLEKWRTIPGHPKYEASTMGRVRKGDKIIKGRTFSVGYQNLILNGRQEYLHRLIAKTFISDIPKGWHVNHLDNNKLNNELSNLEICTPKDNSIHAHQPSWYVNQTQIEGFK
jgi:hypothetical protein